MSIGGSAPRETSLLSSAESKLYIRDALLRLESSLDGDEGFDFERLMREWRLFMDLQLSSQRESCKMRVIEGR